MIINKDVMRDHNERSVLQAIVNHGPISRTEVSKLLGLNKVTVSDIIGSLTERKLVTSQGEARAAASGSGRRPELVAYNVTYGYVINFSISGLTLEMLVTQLDGRALEYSQSPIDNLTVHQVVAKMEEMVRQLPKFKVDNGLQAISIAIFGVVYQNEIISSPFVDFEDVDLVGHFEQRYHVPVIMENEANLSAIFEQDYSKQELQSLVSISIHEGVGAGILLNKQLYTGNYGRAGEVGQMLLTEPDKPRQRLAKLTNFDQEWSQSALLAKAAHLKGRPTYTLADLVRANEQGDAQITHLIEDFCYQLAVVTSNLIIAYDPQLVFFNSPLIDQLPEILKNVQMKLSFMPLVPPLVMSKDVKYATLLGGASLAIHKVLDMTGTRLILHH
ncbi:ROK family transcriptional regulator [Levilactobacillus brevis]|uniref:ROK family transcriptional regulator n=1 Tax=Levilactobacillus brevis TaxID=1580 RepID=UPI00063AA64F|nr:ROK family transcriptional regulator [Levilactobacillus brevis]KLE29893.1 transcriptional regulator [Levilactobacillus brevis]MBT9676705.1 ROK family protein [Levilactobacillus brevis]MCT3568690.1 ROK family transcriptional regulator [Levilactobacillus brevis]MCT3579185.1 ROK family transcriptional regulator [Levilactobacillus brevis]RDF88070.1 ROK family transcriptional regulator [Levilactobacillus brevis]